MSQQRRYKVEEIEGAHYIWDSTKPKSPVTYVLMTLPITQPHANWQFILTSYNARRHVQREQFVARRELWSSYFYAANPLVKRATIQSVLSLLQHLDIENPYELVNEFGGTVMNEVLPMPPIPYPNS